MINSYRKGWRNEKRAIALFEQLGYKCHRAKITRFNKNDFFGFFDFVCIQKGFTTKWVQVKSNRVKAKDAMAIRAFADVNFDREHNRAIILTWKDRLGFFFEFCGEGTMGERTIDEKEIVEAINNVAKALRR